MLLATATLLLAGAAGAQAEVVWLCLPGAEPNPCHESLETTVQEQDGTTRRLHAAPRRRTRPACASTISPPRTANLPLTITSSMP